MRLERIETQGLKATDQVFELGAVNVLIGENGSGKTGILNALELLAYGQVSGLPKNHEGVMRLCRKGKNKILVLAKLRKDDGKIAHIKRGWTRGKSGAIKETIELTGFPRMEGGTKEKSGVLQSFLGSLVEAWRPDDLLALSDNKLRLRLLSIIPDAELDPLDWVPEDCPDWAQHREDEELIDWVARALRHSAEKITVDQKDQRDQVAKLEELEDYNEEAQPIAPIQAKLQELRNELVRRHKLDRLDLEFAENHNAIETRRKRIEELGSFGALERLLLGLAIAGSEGLKIERQEKVLALEDLRARQNEVDEELTELEKIVPSTPEEHKEQSDLLDEYLQRAINLQGKKDKLNGRREVLSEDCPISQCPNCQADLSEHWLCRLEEITAEYTQVCTELAGANRETRARRLVVERASEGVRLVELRGDSDELAGNMDAASEELNKLVVPDMGTTVDRLAVIRNIETLTGQADGLELANEILEAHIDEAGDVQSEDHTEAEIREQEEKLEELGKLNGRVEIVAESREQLESLARRIEGTKKWQTTFKKQQTGILKVAKVWLEDRISATMGEPVTVELVDGRDNQICRIRVGGIDVSTISGGEYTGFCAGLIAALAGAAGEGTGWRPLILDRFETVSAANRTRFLQAIRSSFDENVIDQAIIAGCPDNVPEVEGVRVIRFDQSEAIA